MKIKALISCVVTAQLICAFVFTLAKSVVVFFHEAAQFVSVLFAQIVSELVWKNYQLNKQFQKLQSLVIMVHQVH